MRKCIMLALVAITMQAIAQSPCQQGTILINGSPVDAIELENDNNSGLSLPLWLKEGTTLAAGTRVLFISVIEFDVVNESGTNNLIFNQVLHIGTQSATVPAEKTWKVESIVKHANVLATGFTASSNSPVCKNQSLNLSATSVSGATYEWTGPNGFTSTAQNPVISSASLAAGGTYTVTASLNGCNSAPSTTNVVVNDLPASTFASSPSLVTTNVNTTFTPTVTGATYSWTFNSGTPTSSTVQNPVVQWSSAGNYDVSLTVTDSNQCSSTTAQPVTVSNCIPGQPSSAFTYSPQSVTTGNPTAFSPSASGVTYSWVFNGGSPATSTSQNPSVTWATTGNYDVVLTTISNGCTTTTTIPINVVVPPVNCQAIKASNPSATDGIYTVFPTTGSMSVYCDMTTDDGGWTLVYRDNHDGIITESGTSELGNLNNLQSTSGPSAKYSDAVINALKTNGSGTVIGYRTSSPTVSSRYFHPSDCNYVHNGNSNPCMQAVSSYTTSPSPGYTQFEYWGGGSGGINCWYRPAPYWNYHNTVVTSRANGYPQRGGITNNPSFTTMGGSDSAYSNVVLMWVK